MNLQSTSRRYRYFWPVLILIEAGLLLLHRQSFEIPHTEGDEIVFTFLADRLGEHPLDYHLKGSIDGPAARKFINDAWKYRNIHQLTQPEIQDYWDQLDQLNHAEVLYVPLSNRSRYAYDPVLYNQPLFFHPPLYPYLLSLSRKWGGTHGGILLSIALHGLTVMGIALLARLWENDKIALFAAALMAIEPVAWVCGSRLWIDGLLQCLMVATLFALVGALKSPKDYKFILAGVIGGLALLTKFPAILMTPPILWVGYKYHQVLTYKRIFCFTISTILLVVPWLVIFKMVCGVWLLDMTNTPWRLENYPYLAFIVERPIHFYFSSLLLISPIFIFCVPCLLKKTSGSPIGLLIIWILSIFIGMTVLGRWGFGFSPRFIAPATPALCLLAAPTIARLKWYWFISAICLAFITFMSGFYSAALYSNADVFPYCLGRLIQSGGGSVENVLGHLW